MPSKLLDAWLNTGGYKIYTDHPLNPRIALGSVAPTPSQLDAIDAAEVAAGWNAPTVALNRARRNTTFPVFAGSHGVSIGRLTPEVVGHLDSLRFLDRLQRSWWLGRNLGKAALPVSGITPDSQNARQRLAWAGAVGYSPSVASTVDDLEDVGAHLFKMFTGFEATVVGSGSVAAGTYDATWAMAQPLVAAHVNASTGIMFFPMIIGGSLKLCYLLYQREPWFALSGFRLWYSYVQSFLTNATSGVEQWSYACFWMMGEPGFRNIVGSPTQYGYGGWNALETKETVSADAWTQPGHLQSVTLAWTEWDTIGDAVPQKVPAGESCGLPLISLRVRNMYVFGQPEFCEAFHIIGDTVWDPYARKLNVSGATLGYEWKGSKLSSLATAGVNGVTAQDITDLGSSFVKSVVDPDPLVIEMPLVSKLGISELAGGPEEIYDLVLVEANPSRGVPAIKFREAEKRAVGQDMSVRHTLRSAIANPIIEYVVTAGCYALPDGLYEGRVIMTATDVAGTAVEMTVWFTADGSIIDFVNPGFTEDMFILLDQYVSNGQTPLTRTTPNGFTVATEVGLQDAMRAALAVEAQVFSATASEYRTVSDSVRSYELELREDLLFAGRLPGFDGLSEGQRAGFSLLHGAMSRKQLTSFVIAATMMAKTVGRRLISF